MPDYVPPNHEAYTASLSKQIEDCGLTKREFTVSYQQYLQGYEIVVARSAQIDPATLGCLADAASQEYLVFEDQTSATQFRELSAARYRPQMLQSARETLEQRGLLEGLPMPADFATTQGFLVAIEQHCGLAPGQALELQDGAAIIKPNLVATGEFDKVTCVVSSLIVSGFDNVGFIGNEAIE